MYVSLHIHVLTYVNVPISIGHMTTQNGLYFDVYIFYLLHMIIICLYLYSIDNKLNIQHSCVYTMILIMAM